MLCIYISIFFLSRYLFPHLVFYLFHLIHLLSFIYFTLVFILMCLKKSFFFVSNFVCVPLWIEPHIDNDRIMQMLIYLLSLIKVTNMNFSFLREQFVIILLRFSFIGTIYWYYNVIGCIVEILETNFATHWNVHRIYVVRELFQVKEFSVQIHQTFSVQIKLTCALSICDDLI